MILSFSRYLKYYSINFICILTILTSRQVPNWRNSNLASASLSYFSFFSFISFPQQVRVGHFGSGTGFLITFTSASHISQTYVLPSSAIFITSFSFFVVELTTSFDIFHGFLAMFWHINTFCMSFVNTRTVKFIFFRTRNTWSAMNYGHLNFRST